MSRRAVFLDRDGTLIEERGYLDRIEDLAVFPWSADAVRLLRRAGFVVVVVTNQAAVAHGLIDEAFLASVHRALDRRLGPAAAIDAYYYCPHHPTAGVEAFRLACDCRKPAPGLIVRACRDLDLDPARSVMVGDRWLDVACGQAAGARGVLLRTGHGEREALAPPAGVQADAILDNLMEATGWILRHCSR